MTHVFIVQEHYTTGGRIVAAFTTEAAAIAYMEKHNNEFPGEYSRVYVQTIGVRK